MTAVDFYIQLRYNADCLVSITLSVLHFAWIATAVERVLVLALLALAGAFALAHRR